MGAINSLSGESRSKSSFSSSSTMTPTGRGGNGRSRMGLRKGDGSLDLANTSPRGTTGWDLRGDSGTLFPSGFWGRGKGSAPENALVGDAGDVAADKDDIGIQRRPPSDRLISTGLPIFRSFLSAPP